MSESATKPAHTTVLRIPGSWRDERELGQELPEGFRLGNQRFFMPGQRVLELQFRPADGEFANVFRSACRRKAENGAELLAVDGYNSIAALIGPAGSMSAARLLLEAGAAVIRAGGYGVFIDNGCVAHTRSDWLELAEHRADSDAVFYAFVNFVRLKIGVMSRGMHVLGQRDARVARESELPALEDFLRMLCDDQPSVSAGQQFADKSGRRFKLRAERDRGIFQNHPVNNPYGFWILESA
jgi:hypothetical protein